MAQIVDNLQICWKGCNLLEEAALPEDFAEIRVTPVGKIPLSWHGADSII